MIRKTRRQAIRVLGIESSCDETAAAVVAVRRESSAGISRKPSVVNLPRLSESRGRQDRDASLFSFNVRSNVVASQVRIHARTGGVVPEVAAREHVERIIPVIERALRDG
ncbi:MAG: hypothetical protein V1723_00715, partial [Candidatus Uhrbacteria bacterium]